MAVSISNHIDLPFNKVVVHPLVLLSVVDHFTRVAKDTKKRVCGILLGEVFKGKVDITNSYAVPFEEDAKDSNIWFFDHNYHEQMFSMFHKVSSKEKVVGWYSTAPKIKAADIEINEVVRRYTSDPVFVIIDVNPQDELEIPTNAFVSTESPPELKSQSKRTFAHLPSEIGAYEAEEVGVEHLVREIRDIGGSTIADLVSNKINSLKGLEKRLGTMNAYLTQVAAGTLAPNYEILYNIQDIFNTMPDLQAEELVKSFKMNTNDNMVVLYLATLIRSILALHSLIDNKLKNQLLEQQDQEQKKKKKEEKKKEAEEKKKKAAEEEEGDEKKE